MRSLHLHGRGTALGLIFGALLLFGSSAAAEEKVVIYRCTDAKGAVTIQNNVPCPKGSKQERRVMETTPTTATPPPAAPSPPPKSSKPAPRATTAPRPVPPPAPPPPPAPAPQPALVGDAGGERLPPPILYECRTYDDDTYISENGTPQQRCVALNTTGLGGISAEGAGTACEMKTDRCQRVPDGALCDAWRKRLREAKSAQRFGSPADREFANAEVERVGRIVRESVCSQ